MAEIIILIDSKYAPVVMFAFIIFIIIMEKINNAIIKRNFLKSSIKFDGYIIGVARQNQRIEVSELVEDDETAFLGSPPSFGNNLLAQEYTRTKRYNLTGFYSRRWVGHAGESRVKISYIHPETGLHTIVRTIMQKSAYRDSRIYRISQPNLIRFNTIGFIIWKHNHNLFSAYKKDVESRNITEQEKKTLLREAQRARKSHYDKYFAKPPIDSEGYSVIDPPVLVQGYYLNGEFVFIQRTNEPVLEDWTKDLK